VVFFMMIPRIFGNVGQADEGEHLGKWFFQLWVSELGKGKGEGDSLGIFGPFETEEIAHRELNHACQLACATYEKNVFGHVSGKYIDMKTNQTKTWNVK
jgi:hypothetical protein